MPDRFIAGKGTYSGVVRAAILDLKRPEQYAPMHGEGSTYMSDAHIYANDLNKENGYYSPQDFAWRRDNGDGTDIRVSFVD